MAYRDRISEELNQIENFDEVKASLEKETSACYDSLKKQADLLTAARQRSAAQLEKSIEKELHDLNFGEAKLAIDFQKPDVIGPDGNDLVEILITTNKGEPLKPLVKIASGGEISRIMLAIKKYHRHLR